MDLSFSGAGFMGCYYFGVVDCWNKYIPRERINRVAGASAGSLSAAYYLLDLPLSTCLREIIGLTEEIRRRPLGVFDRTHQIVDVLPKILDKLFPDDAHKRVSGKLYVCMTRMKDMKKVIVSEYESKKDLIDALNCSCFIPVWSGNHVSTYKGVKHIDGGFSDNLPVFDEHTVRICCFSGATDISPYDRAKMELLSAKVVNMPLNLNFGNCRRLRKALFPPSADYMVSLLEQGFHDTKDFILSNDLIQCDTCYGRTDIRDQPIFSTLSPTITPSVTPSVSRSCSYTNLNDFKAFNKSIHNETKSSPSRGNFLKPAGGSPNNTSLHADKKKSFSFSNLLHDKLQRSCSPDSNLSFGSSSVSKDSGAGRDSGCSNAPIIIIDNVEESERKAASGSGLGSDGDSNSDSSGASSAADEQPPRDKVSPNKYPTAFRRNTVQDDQLLVIKDKYTLAASPLPSCPPSPNLNRRCTECIQMRQEARMDMVEEEVRLEAEKYRQVRQIKENSFTSKLTSPLRWLRQLGVKSSYKFDGNTDA